LRSQILPNHPVERAAQSPSENRDESRRLLVEAGSRPLGRQVAAVPLTRGGRQRKLGKLASGAAWLVALAAVVAVPVVLAALLIALL